MTRFLLAAALGAAVAGASAGRAIAGDNPEVPTLRGVEREPDPNWELESELSGQRVSGGAQTIETGEGIDQTSHTVSVQVNYRFH